VQPHTPAGRCSTQEKDGQPRRADAAEEVLLPRAAGDDRDGRAAGGGGRRSMPGRAATGRGRRAATGRLPLSTRRAAARCGDGPRQAAALGQIRDGSPHSPRPTSSGRGGRSTTGGSAPPPWWDGAEEGSATGGSEEAATAAGGRGNVCLAATAPDGRGKNGTLLALLSLCCYDSIYKREWVWGLKMPPPGGKNPSSRGRRGWSAGSN